jgi:hypothetical protein
VERRKNVSEGGENKVCSHGLVHVKAWEGGEGHGQGMFEVWCKESKCERHRTEESGGQEKRQLTKESVKKKRTKKAAGQQKKKMPHFLATMVTP